MKDHHEYSKISLGASDVASLVLRFPCGSKVLDFGEDGGYSSYLVDEECIIPDHYSLECECEHWLWIYDDTSRTLQFDGEKIRVFRAGVKGCIIQIFGGKK